MCAAALWVVACEKNTDRAAYFRENSGLVKSGELLRNELPPEQLEGTPVPIAFSGMRATEVPPQNVPGPGTLGVKFGLLE